MINRLNVKYILGEICLIFIGISLAIWFNNWNKSKQISQNKEIVIKRVIKEINTNLEDLLSAREVNQKMVNNYLAYSNYFGLNTNEVITTPKQMSILQRRYPSFFIITDSIRLEKNEFKYFGGTNVDLELVELTNIAWKTAQTLDIANEFSYGCLYELESMYNLQTKLMNGFEKVANTLGDNKEIEKVVRWLQIVSQFEVELEKDYRKMLEEIEKCR